MKRYGVKYIRDGAKAAYSKGPCCEICGSNENLDLHHFASLADLWNRWWRKKKLGVETEEKVLEVRQEFIDDHHKELYEDVVTLCHEHHLRLHSIFGKTPSLGTVVAQRRWIDNEYSKLSNKRENKP